MSSAYSALPCSRGSDGYITCSTILRIDHVRCSATRTTSVRGEVDRARPPSVLRPSPAPRQGADSTPRALPAHAATPVLISHHACTSAMLARHQRILCISTSTMRHLGTRVCANKWSCACACEWRKSSGMIATLGR